MQVQSQVTSTQVERAISASQNHLLSLQTPHGYWWAELESNVTITGEVVLLHKIWGTDRDQPLKKYEAYLRSQQREHGGWELFHGDGGELSTSVEGYMALRLLGVPATDAALTSARQFILARGGISKTRIFTKFHLALIGCFDWSGIPSIPPWVMLLPQGFPFTIYELSSWARSSTVPLMIVFDQKPVYRLEEPVRLDELYVDPSDPARFSLPRSGEWSDVFVILDGVFKFFERLDIVPFRRRGLEAAKRWVLERQEATGDWAGIMPAMLNSLLCLRSLGLDVDDPIVQRGMEAVERFMIESTDTVRVQPCVSPVWDTALVMRSLVASGLHEEHPALIQGGEWMLRKQILDYGDWAIKNRRGLPGAWAFEFENRFYPDVDDTAVVVMALQGVRLPNERRKQAAMQRAIDWILTMQCRDGGWAAFDLDNDQNWLNALPYADLKAMIDPSTADVTARVLEMVARSGAILDADSLDRALAYLVNEQEAEGCWFGRWGVNYLYGTSGVLSALSLIAPNNHKQSIERGAEWMVSCQNPDGGWGETCRSYADPSLKGKGVSTASQTAWAMIGLIAAGRATGSISHGSLERSAAYLVSTQHADGNWNEAEFTGTGFPCHFYLKYHLYQQHFPLTALGQYWNLLRDGSTESS